MEAAKGNVTTGKKDNKIARKILLTNAKWKTSTHDNGKNGLKTETSLGKRDEGNSSNTTTLEHKR